MSPHYSLLFGLASLVFLAGAFARLPDFLGDVDVQAPVQMVNLVLKHPRQPILRLLIRSGVSGEIPNDWL